ncbi:hypothetical protein WDW86_00430 [Bdellovibrionota bacterium FG-2]
MKNPSSTKPSLREVLGRRHLAKILAEPCRKRIILHPSCEFLRESLKAVNCKYVWDISKLGLSSDASDLEIVKAMKRGYRADHWKRGYVLITRELKPFSKLISKEFDVLAIPESRPSENFSHNLKSILLVSISSRGPRGVVHRIDRTRSKYSGGYNLIPVAMARKK